MGRFNTSFKKIKSICAVYGFFLYLFDPPKTLLTYISAVICLLIIIIIDIYYLCKDKHDSDNN